MKAVWSWLLEHCELEGDVSPERGADALTDMGLEVESIERTGEGISGVVVGEVVSKGAHPQADKLTVCKIRRSHDGPVFDVVCGAPNVPEPGGRVVWAAPGATLPGGIEIAAKKVRGVESAGMLCAEDELGISEDHDGIMILEEGAALGSDARSALCLGEVVFDVGIPANRGDCFGHIGLARELVAAVGGSMKPPRDGILDGWIDEGLSAEDLATIVIEDPESCPRYIAMVIDGVVVGPSPRWMQERLRAVGVRPVSNLVDVTNYVMFETGQPFHAFDYAAIAGARVTVKRAGSAITKMKTLDSLERTIEPDDLLICDDGGAVALAGVMGGLDSEIGDGTRRVLLETASFDPGGIRKTARRLGLHSEASHRFERGVDRVSSAYAAQRCAQLLAELSGGRVAKGMVDSYPCPLEPSRLPLRVGRATSLTGVEFTADVAQGLLSRLGLRAETTTEAILDVEVPTFRADLTREVDVIEELIRLRGYDSVPATLPQPSGAARPSTALQARRVVKDTLRANGLSEAITFGFTAQERIDALEFGEQDRRSLPIAIVNPMTRSQAVMRTTLLANLLGAVAHNINHGVRDIGLFEVGTIFLAKEQGELPDEPQSIAAVLSGSRREWFGQRPAVDFYDLKRCLEAVFRALDLEALFEEVSSIPFLHPGVAANVSIAGENVGFIGEIHPTTRERFEIDAPVFAFEIDVGGALRLPLRQMTSIARHPSVTRDISFFIDCDVSAQRVTDVIGAAAVELLESVDVLEDFRDERYVPAGKKGMLWSVTYRANDRTLTDREVDAAHEPLVDKLLEELSATRR